MSYASEIEYYTEMAKRYSNRDDGLDGDFIEEEWQFVRDAEDDDDNELFEKPARPDFYIDEDDDEDDANDDAGEWDDSDEEEDDDEDDNFDDWVEESEDDEPEDEE